MVRLKVYEYMMLDSEVEISIPYGAIKSGIEPEEFYVIWTDFNSLWCD